MAVSQDIQEKVLEEAYSVTPNYDINYNDPRFGKVESAKGQALTELEQTYAGMIGQSDQYYNAQIQATQDWAAKQQQLQQDRTDFAIEQINQQKEQANKDYLKEQSGAYVDWQKQSNKYGTNAEQMASAGLTNTGFSESSQVSMYNTYQNRVAAARESYNQAVLNYNNAIKDAMLQNNEALAQIAYESLQKSLELSLAGFQYKNQLILEQSNKKIELDNMYYNRYQDVLQQINHENAIKEDIRQYNETQKWNTEQKELDRAFQADQAELGREHDKAMADIEYQYQVKLDEAKQKFEAAEAALDRQHELDVIGAKTTAEKDIIDKQWEIEQKRLKEESANEIAKITAQKDAEIAILDHKNSLEDKPISYVTGGNTKSKSYTTAGKDAFINRVTNNPRTTKTTFNGSTYNEAVSYMKSKGVSTAGVLTASEWSRRKSSYSMTGIGNAAVKNYKSYAEYLRAYVNSTVANK
jgi:hypothetical protein